MSRKILFLTTEIPYPLDSGGKIRTYNIIKGIRKYFEIDLVCFIEDEKEKVENSELVHLCNEIKIVKKTFTNDKNKKVLLFNIIKSAIKFTPFIVEKFVDKNYINIVKKLQEQGEYEAVIIDHLQIASYKKYVSSKNIILSQHNCENLILKRRYEKEVNIIKKLYFKMEYLKTLKYERNTCLNMSKVIVLSEEDKEAIINTKYDGSNMDIVPISIESEYLKLNHINSVKNILFMGTMSWYPNEQGILWFIENVWDDLIKIYPNIKLYIVGKNPSESIKKYECNNIVITGYVEDVNKYIEECDICIVPLFIGGGMRVKILECMAKGIPCISTTIGAEGIKYNNYSDIIIANDSDGFIKSIKLLSEDSNLKIDISRNAKKNVEINYSIDMIGSKVKNIINEVKIYDPK